MRMARRDRLANLPDEFVRYFLSRVVVDAKGCWHWGHERRRYAVVLLPGSQMVSAHRVSHVIFGGRDTQS